MLSSIESLKSMNFPIFDSLPINEKVVLNIGCGTGEAPLFTVLGAKNYVGIDYSFTAVSSSI